MVNLQKNPHAVSVTLHSRPQLKKLVENAKLSNDFRKAVEERYSYLVKRDLRAFLHSA